MNRRGPGPRIGFTYRHIRKQQAAGVQKPRRGEKGSSTPTDMPLGETVLPLARFGQFQNVSYASKFTKILPTYTWI